MFKYFPKIPSEVNSKHSFYSILIPMTSHAKIFILVVGGPRNKGNDHKFWGMGCFKIFWVNDKKSNDLRQTYRQTYILSLVVLSAALQQKIKLQIMVVIIDGYSDMCAHFADFAKFILGGNLIYFYIYIYISLLQIRACAIYFEPPSNTNTTSLRFLNNINVKYK